MKEWRATRPITFQGPPRRARGPIPWGGESMFRTSLTVVLLALGAGCVPGSRWGDCDECDNRRLTPTPVPAPVGTYPAVTTSAKSTQGSVAVSAAIPANKPAAGPVLDSVRR